MDKKLTWSTDGERYYSEFPDELEPGQKYWQAEQVDIKPSDLLFSPADHIEEMMREQLYEKVGDVGYDGITIHEEVKHQLDLVIKAFLDVSVEVACYGVENVKEVYADALPVNHYQAVLPYSGTGDVSEKLKLIRIVGNVIARKPMALIGRKVKFHVEWMIKQACWKVIIYNESLEASTGISSYDMRDTDFVYEVIGDLVNVMGKRYEKQKS